MAAIPHSWDAYGRVQTKLLRTRCIAIGAAFEEALNIVHAPGFQDGDATEPGMQRATATAARAARHRAVLRQRTKDVMLGDGGEPGDDQDEPATGALSLDDAVHARRQLTRLAVTLPGPDWHLLLEVAEGTPYSVLAKQQSATTAMLRSRVCRLRAAIGPG